MQSKFKLSTVQLGNYTILQLCHTEYDVCFSIIPELGGSLNAFTVNGQEILVAASTLKEIENLTIKAFAGAQLFPYPNRIKEGKYTIGDTPYQLPINDISNNNSLHGLTYNKTFQVVATDIENGIINLKYKYDSDDKGYPFHVIVENRFQLSENSLSITTTLENKSNQTIPIGHGWHPYFKISQGVDNAFLQIPTTENYQVDQHMIPTGKTMKYDLFSKATEIAETKFDHCFKIKNDNSFTAQLINPEKNLTISLLTEGYPYLQVYIPPQRDSIALEPQTSIPDAFNNKIGGIDLEVNQKVSFKFQIVVD